MQLVRFLFLPFFLLTILAKSQEKPNILIIMADDLDSKQLSCYGGKNLKTPHIDGLAKSGIKFTNFCASEAMCVPTRASLFTGLYPVRHGAFQNHKSVYDTLKSVVHYLGDVGYRVALTGKDHVTKPKNVFPFDIVKGFEPNCVAYTDDYQLDSVRTYISKKDKPYCLFVMSTNPHTPWSMGDSSEFDPTKLVLPKTWVDTKEARGMFAKYLAEVRRLDNQVGDLVKLLKESNQFENTVFIFLGEQGPQFPGGKWNLWEYGVQSSMIVHWPGKVKPSTQTNALVQYEDITPTLIDLVGGRAVSGLDGKSFLPLLLGKSTTAGKYAYGIHNNIPEGTPYAMRSIRDERYKLILNLSSDQSYYNRFMMNPDQKRKDTFWFSWKTKGETDATAKRLTDRIEHRPVVEFYDLEKDPWELDNLANDPSRQKTIAHYKSELEKWMAQQKDPGTALDITYTKK